MLGGSSALGDRATDEDRGRNAQEILGPEEDADLTPAVDDNDNKEHRSDDTGGVPIVRKAPFSKVSDTVGGVFSGRRRSYVSLRPVSGTLHNDVKPK